MLRAVSPLRAQNSMAGNWKKKEKRCIKYKANCSRLGSDEIVFFKSKYTNSFSSANIQVEAIQKEKCTHNNPPFLNGEMVMNGLNDWPVQHKAPSGKINFSTYRENVMRNEGGHSEQHALFPLYLSVNFYVTYCEVYLV